MLPSLERARARRASREPHTQLCTKYSLVYICCELRCCAHRCCCVVFCSMCTCTPAEHSFARTARSRKRARTVRQSESHVHCGHTSAVCCGGVLCVCVLMFCGWLFSVCVLLVANNTRGLVQRFGLSASVSCMFVLEFCVVRAHLPMLCVCHHHCHQPVHTQHTHIALCTHVS